MVGIGKIARRYLVINAFDGTLTIIGLIVGSWLSGVIDPVIVLKTGYATALAIGVSGLWGAYMTEAAERRDDLAHLSKQTLTDLSNTDLWKAMRVATIVVAIVNGIAPFLAACLIMLPFFFHTQLGGINISYTVSVAIAFLNLFILGVFLGGISETSRAWSGIKMVAAGLLCAALSYLVGHGR